MEELHIPGQTDAQIEKSVEVPPAPAPTEPPAPEETKPGETVPEGAAPEAAKPEDAPTPPEPIPTSKPRSIFKDLKETRQEKNQWKDTAVAAAKAQGIELRGDETPEQIQSLLTKKPDAPVEPKAPEQKPANELEVFATEQGLDPTALIRLKEIITKDIPVAQLSTEERQTLEDLKAYKQTADAKEQRRQEDDAIQAEAPKVKEQLSVHDDAELAKVMAEVTRLAHTDEFADKEVAYIVWKKQADLSKLVSPKKPSFEAGGSPAEAAPEPEIDYSKGGLTPEQLAKGSTAPRPSPLEIRKSK